MFPAIIGRVIRESRTTTRRISFRKHVSTAACLLPKTGLDEKSIEVNIFVPHENLRMKLQAKLNSNLRTLVNENDDLKMFLECACEGNAICSTCHVHVVPEFSKKLEAPEEMELDILDLLCDYDERSRLGCQIKFTAECDGITLIVPESVTNFL